MSTLDHKLRELPGYDPDDPSFAAPKSPPRAPDPIRRDQRRVRWAMVAIGLAIWIVALPVSGWNLELLVLSAVLVWASFGLLTE